MFDGGVLSVVFNVIKCHVLREKKLCGEAVGRGRRNFFPEGALSRDTTVRMFISLFCALFVDVYIFTQIQCVFIELHIAAQSEPVILVVLCHSHWSFQGGDP